MIKDVKGLSIAPWSGAVSWDEYDYGLVTMLSVVKLEAASDLAAQNIDMEEVIEARLFSRERELHLWQENGQLKGSVIMVSDEAEALPFSFDVTSAVSDYSRVTGRKLLGIDEDGQAYIVCTKLDSAAK